MIALHVSVRDGASLLWCEGGDLAKAAKAAGFDVRLPKREEYVAWLPAKGARALPSSPLIGDVPPGRSAVRIAPFPVSAVPLTFDLTAALAGIVGNGPVPGSGVMFGASAQWFARAVLLARECAASGGFLPGLAPAADGWEARWSPAPDERLGARADELAGSMPGACRCLGRPGEPAPDEPARRDVAAAFLARCVDAFVRASGGDLRQFPGQRRYASLHDAWIAALTSPDPALRWDDAGEVAAFARALVEWRRKEDLSGASPFRFCFRLEEPGDGDGEQWRVACLLQPKAEQSLLFSVSDLWRNEASVLRQAGRFGDPREFVLSALGRAAALCPSVEEGLKAGVPGDFTLDGAGALEFLRDHAPALHGAGFSVFLPSWWVRGAGPSPRLKPVARSSRSEGSGELSLESVVEFDYRVTIGDEELSPEELRSIVKLKTPFVKLRGRWMQVDRERLQSCARFLERMPSGSKTGRELLFSALGASGDDEDDPVRGAVLVGEFGDLLKRLADARPDPLPAPAGLNGTLREYQSRGYSWLAFLRKWRLGACLADDMGLGKTIQALALVQRERENGETRPVLLVCPTSVINNWRREAERFAPGLPVTIHHGATRRKKGFEKLAESSAIVVSSYALLQRDAALMAPVRWAGIILDEAQNVKNPDAKQSRAVRSLEADYRIALTGTPVENHVGDLWALMDFLNPGLLGSRSSFDRRFLNPIRRSGDAEAAARLKRLTAPFILRRLKSDKAIISDLPDKIEMKTYCTLTKEQATLYAAVLADLEERLSRTEGMDRRGLVLATLLRLKQVCNHPAQFAADGSGLEGRSGKLRRLVEMLEEARETDGRTLVFTQFAEMGELLKTYLQEYFCEEVFLIHGGVARKKRDEMIARFQEDARAPHVFVLSLKAGGSGINLTRADRVIHYDRWWNPAVENQATDRAYRIGQTKNVQVFKYLVAGTLEEKIDRMIERKSAVAESVVGAGENWITELSDGELLDVVRLETEATGE